jgi:hypothetical protein
LGTHYATFSKEDRAAYSMFLDNTYLDDLVKTAVANQKQNEKENK